MLDRSFLSQFNRLFPIVNKTCYLFFHAFKPHNLLSKSHYDLIVYLSLSINVATFQIAFIWSCLDAQDDRKDDDQKTLDKATQAPELFTKYQKILNEEGT